jgi:hypothetical protein
MFTVVTAVAARFTVPAIYSLSQSVAAGELDPGGLERSATATFATTTCRCRATRRRIRAARWMAHTLPYWASSEMSLLV